jgi:hypothetical protein
MSERAEGGDGICSGLIQTPRLAVPWEYFARGMLSSDASFTQRVARLEARHGPLCETGLSVAAQANYVCWFEASFPKSLIDACRAIGEGRPNRLTLCQQVSPQRWCRLHEIVVAVQRWLGDPRRTPEGLDGAEVARWQALLGSPVPARMALARLYLWTLVQHLRLNTSLGQLAAEGSLETGMYADYAGWYRDQEGRMYGREGWERLLAACRASLSSLLADGPADGDRLLGEIEGGPMGKTRPPCAQRFLRYQEIRLASIGALRWRSNLPADPRPRAYWEGLFAQCGAALQAWLAGRSPDGKLAAQIHAALGDHTLRKRAFVALFLQAMPGEGCFAWLAADARERGALAERAFEREGTR